MSECLSEEQIDRLLTGELEESQERQWDSHVSSCRVCTETMRQRSSSLDALAKPRVRNEVLQQSALDLPPQIRAALAQAKGFRHGQARDEPRQTVRQESLAAGSVIGNYRLLKPIGTGGMGSVWQCEQSAPVRRQVALKVVKGADATEEILERFEAERQALASMSHPHIAQIYDAGRTADGRPYFAMEFVDGISITTLCDRQQLSIESRLRLFIHVCLAVQHAHQKGIIHRDLKPSNILVAMVDGHPAPKIIDFGLAKAIAPIESDNRAELTERGQVLGTLKYMSPEQASLNAVDVDTRTDVYALGAVLCELLSGSTPITQDFVETHSMLDVLATIRDREPLRPSQLFRQGTATEQQRVAKNRRTEPQRLQRDLNGDLDWIVAKALELDRNRRYASAHELASDVQRLLSSEPIAARPPTLAYRAAKFVRRNRLLVTASSLVFLALVAGLAGTLWGLLRADDARRDALAAQASESRRADREHAAKVAANQARQEADKRLAQIEKGNELLSGILMDLNLYGAAQGRQQLDVAISERLRELSKQMVDDTYGDPLTVARLQQHLGSTLHSMGYLLEAMPLYEASYQTMSRILGDADPQVMVALNNLAMIYMASSRDSEALPWLEKVYEAQLKDLGPEHPDLLMTQCNLAAVHRQLGDTERAIELLKDNLASREKVLGAGHADTLTTRHQLAVTYKAAGNLESAEQAFQQTLDLRKTHLGDQHPDTLGSKYNLGSIQVALGDLDRGIPLLEEAFEQGQRTLGKTHPDTLLTMNDLALAYQHAGRVPEAMELFQSALQSQIERLGPEHGEVMTTRNNLAGALQSLGRLEEARELYTQVLQALEAKLGPNHLNVLMTKGNLASNRIMAGDFDTALKLWIELEPSFAEAFGAGHPATITARNNLAYSYQALQRYDEAIRIYQTALDSGESTFGDEHPFVLGLKDRLGTCLLKVARREEGVALVEAAYRGRLATLGPQHAETWTSMKSLAQAYLETDQAALALPLIDSFLDRQRQRTDLTSIQLADILDSEAAPLRAAGQLDPARRLLTECLEIRQREAPESWATASAKCKIGSVLLQMNELGEAKQWLSAGWQGLKRHESAPIDPELKSQLLEVVEELIELSRREGLSEEQARWEQERERLRGS